MGLSEHRPFDRTSGNIGIDPVREIHRRCRACTPSSSSAVPSHARGYVGDRDQQAPAFLVRSQNTASSKSRASAPSIVTRACRAGPGPPVWPRWHLDDRDAICCSTASGHFDRDVVGANRHVRCHAGRGGRRGSRPPPERLPPLLRMIVIRPRPSGPCLAPPRRVRRDQDLLREPLVVRQQERDAGLDLQTPTMFSKRARAPRPRPPRADRDGPCRPRGRRYGHRATTRRISRGLRNRSSTASSGA